MGRNYCSWIKRNWTHLRNGWKIVSYFGGQGFRANAGKNVWENTFGYPAEGPFDGGNLDECWGTIPPQISDLEVEEGPDSFRVSFEALHEDVDSFEDACGADG